MINRELVLVLLFLLGVVFSVYSSSLNIKQDKSPVKIQSDSMKYYGTERKSVFSGNVVAVNDNFTLTSNNITVFLNKDMDVDKIKCDGNVNFKTQDIVSISEKAEIDQKKGTAVISGGVKVWQGENYLEGDKVLMYYKENRIVVDKGSKKRVTIIFKPEEEGLKVDSRSKKP